ncbi:hypothetical protein BK133_10360 [Paenibacillus sp. FSL H8-0548]|uniref:SpaA isopeptide-forming pilin-related protein n=1 Tax=Paenibacillus sp. FSL H8-0548 TaxID=1920422 RepID=UPI0009700A1E|nr:SpaA isopeptide-forming pilin-related protein [Paenibacillus sp. FSL H8-0548]OMF35843.1 hypothetical protein BK133_10360 [Paenibacillus sp. FSL H8-0548]
MYYWKKRVSVSLSILLILSLALGSLVMADAGSSGGSATTDPIIENSCQQYSDDKINVEATNASIVDNGDGTATATFKTKLDCVRVSFSSYAAPEDWTLGPNETTIPYLLQTHFNGKTIEYPKAGSHSITINIPKCLPYQLDIYSGKELITLGVGAHGDKILGWKLKLTNTCKGNITINKFLNHVDGAPHAGITFELWKNDVLYTTGATDVNGVLQFNDLPIGNYVLKEQTLNGFTTDLAITEQIAVTMDSSKLKVVINTPKLKLEAACSADPNQTRNWTVINESDIEVPYTWDITGSPQTGGGTVAGAASTPIISTAEITDPIAPNTLNLHWGSDKTISLVNSGELCPTPTPTTPPSPTPTTETSPTPTISTTPTTETSPTPTTGSTPTTVTSPTPTTNTTPTTETSPAPTTSTAPSETPDVLIDLEDEDTPIGGVNAGVSDEVPIETIVDLGENKVPLAALPKTGDSSPIPYYLIGAFALTVGFTSLRKQRKQR